MKLFIDNQYTPGFIRLITSLHSMQFSKSYEIVSGEWTNEFDPAGTVVFLWDTNKKGLSPQIIKYFQDGYKVFAYRKPFGKPMDLFKLTLLLLSQWQRMLETIENENSSFLFTISDSKKILRRVA